MSSVQQAILKSLGNVIQDESHKDLLHKFEAFLKAIPENELTNFQEAFESHGKSWGFQPKNNVAQKVLTELIHAMYGQLKIKGKTFAEEALGLAKQGRSVVMISNHLSYGDVNFLHGQLGLNGLKDFPLLVMAGPKVYSDAFRLLSSMAFDSLKMAQPPSRASGDAAEISRRELAEITRKVIEDCKKYQELGRILFFFPEGSRSRSGGLNAFIPAVFRYVDQKDTIVYPIGFTGTEGLVGVDEALSVSKTEIKIGKGIEFDQLKVVMQEKSEAASFKKNCVDYLGYAVSSLLPEEKRGYYSFGSTEDKELQEVQSLYLTDRSC